MWREEDARGACPRVSPSERLLKALHAAIDRHRLLLDAAGADTMHAIRFEAKPRAGGFRVSLEVETAEEQV